MASKFNVNDRVYQLSGISKTYVPTVYVSTVIAVTSYTNQTRVVKYTYKLSNGETIDELDNILMTSSELVTALQKLIANTQDVINQYGG